MIRIDQLKLSIHHKPEDLTRKAAKPLRIWLEDIRSLHIVKQFVDTRKKEELLFIYTVDAKTGQEENLIRKAKNVNIVLVRERPYQFPSGGEKWLAHPPVIVGSGLAGLFCGLILAEVGYRPILLERGMDVDVRVRKVAEFWKHGVLDTSHNVQFGEGGTGTFSDGELNTLVKDPMKRNQKALGILVEHGADPAILYPRKPHIGTDVLSQVVENIREHIIALGGQVRLRSWVTDTLTDGRTITDAVINETERLEMDVLILAINHSARDIFEMLLERQVPMQQKPSAISPRTQHPQKMITQSQCGTGDTDILGPASYKLTEQTSSGHSVYPFCVCPGGYVVGASPESDRLTVNSMSNHDRGGENANSALTVTVTPEDLGSDSPLAGVAYQRKLEELAYRYGKGHIPVQLYGDFKMRESSVEFGAVNPKFKGRYQFVNLREMFLTHVSEALLGGIDSFGHIICGFDRSDSILAGIESWTSSPVRINRGNDFESEIKGLFPCGEGAGYAGGITPTAMDGIKVAEEIAGRYHP